MKKLILIAIISLFASVSFAEGLGVGARISYQSEGMMGDGAEYFADETVSSGYAVGASVLYHFSEMMSLRTGLELQFQIYSWTQDSPVSSKDVDYSYLFMNLDIPVLARINFTRGFFAEAGLDVAINMLAQGYDSYNDEWEDFKDWNTIQLGPTVGVGYTMWFGLEFGARMTYGLLEPGDDADFRPFRFQIDISYWFMK